jgi:hypothetical protein
MRRVRHWRSGDVMILRNSFIAFIAACARCRSSVAAFE